MLISPYTVDIIKNQKRPKRNKMNEKLGLYPINSIVCDDCLNVLPQLPDKCIDLIYIDPPFGDNAIDKHFGIKWGATQEQLEWFDNYFGTCVRSHKRKSQAAHYLHFMHKCLALMYRLLSDTGSIYVHLDYRMDSYIRLTMDEIWGEESLVNEIIWCYTRPSRESNLFPRIHGTILFYSKTENRVFNRDDIRIPYHEESLARSARSPGKMSMLGNRGEDRLHEGGKIPEDWWLIPKVQGNALEYTGFPTQKPEALLERIIRASSNSGDLVADFFCGSGTMLAVAERLERNWFGCDINREAIEISWKRIEKERAKYPLF